MQKRVVYNFNAHTATGSAAKNSTDKAVKASNAISKIKRAFSGKSIKLAVLVVLLFVSLFCTIGSADWIISQQKNVPNSQDGSANATFKFDDLGLNNHIDIPNVAFSGNPAQANFKTTAPNSGRDLPAEVKQNIQYKIKPYNQTSAQSRVSRAPKNAAASTAKNMAPAAYANETLPDENFFDGIEWTKQLPTEAGTYAVLITSKVGDVSYGKAIKVFTIAPCPVKIVWSGNQGFTYDGTAHPITAIAYEAAENGTPITGNILSISLTYKAPGADSTATTAVSEVKNAGTYTATVTITNKNYAISSNETYAKTATTTFKVEQKALTVTADNKTVTYGNSAPAYTFSCDGLVSTDSAASLGTPEFACSYSTTSTVAGNPYEIKVSGLTNSNYKITYYSGTLTVNKREVTLNWGTTSFVYNGEAQTPNPTANNVVTGNDLGLTVTITGENITGSSAINVGTYTAEAAITNDNYVIAAGNQTATFTITARALTLNWGTTSFVYDGKAQTPNPTVNNAVTGDNLWLTVTITGENITGSPAAAINVGTYTAEAAITNNNYVIAADNKTTFTITARELTLDWGTTSFVYNGEAHTPNPTVNNAVTGDNLGLTITITENITGSPAAAINVGTYTAEATITNNNYVIAAGNKTTLTVTPGTITVTVIGKTISYGDTAPTSYELTCDNADINANISVLGTPKFSCDYTTKSPVGTYPITVSGLTLANYEIECKPSMLTVEKRKITIVWDNTTFTYNDEAHTPNPTTNNVVNNDNLGLTVTITGENITGSPAAAIKAGTYTATASITNKNYVIASGSQTSFGIAKLQVKLTGVITRNYISGGYTFNKDLFNGANDTESTDGKVVCYFTAVDSAYSGVDLSGVYNDITFSSSSRAKNFGNANGLAATPENGLFSYKPNEPIKAGSTYLISGVQLNNNSNFELTTNSFYLKYCTAKIGTDPNAPCYTIEDALAQSGDITLCGGANGDSSYVITAFAKLSPLTGDDFKNYKSDYKYTLSNNIELAPFENAKTTNGLINSDSNDRVYSCLCIPMNLTLNVSSNLIIGGAIGDCGKTTARSVLYNNGTINLNSGNIYSYGYIKGNGLINQASGTTITDVFRIHDWLGGRNSLGIVDNAPKVFPLTAYSIHNIACKTRIFAGAEYKAYFYVTTSITNFESTIIMVGKEAATQTMFQLKNGHVDKSASEQKTKPGTGLSTITGSNQTVGQKDIVTLNGDCTDGTISITKSGYTIGTSKERPIPISYMDITVESGDLKLNNVSYKFMPGTSLRVGKNGSLTVGSGVTTWFYSLEQCIINENVIYTNNGTVTPYPAAFATASGGNIRDRFDSYLEIDGTATYATGSFVSGKICSTTSEATITINGSTTAEIYILKTIEYKKTSFGGSNVTSAVSSSNAFGNIQTSNSTFSADMNMSAGTYYSRILNDHIVWYSSIATISFDTNSTTTISPKTGIAIGINGYTISASDLSNEPTKEHYSFAGWYFDKDLTTEALGQTIFASCTLYAKWTPITYSITYVIEYDEGAISSGNVINNNPSSYTIESNFYLSIPKDGDLKFICWYEDAGHNSEITQIINKGGNLTLYGVFYDSSLVVFTVEYVTNNSDYEIAAQNIKSTEANSFRPEDLSLKNNDKTYAYRFEGWYTSPDFTENSKFTELSSSCILYGKWVEKIHLDVSIDGSEYLTVRYLNPGDNGTVPQVEERTGYRTNIQAIAGCVIADGKYTVNEDATIVKIAITYIKLYSITLSINNATIIINGKSYSASTTIKDIAVANETITYSITFTESDPRTFTIKAGTTNIANGTANTANATFLMPEADVTITASSSSSGDSCLAEGTLITLADGTRKKVEDITENDMLLVFNHYTGKYDFAKVLFNDHTNQPARNYTIINLYFSNGKTVKVVYEHGFFDLDENKYVYITEQNYSYYIGHRFYSATWDGITYSNSIITLDRVVITNEFVKVYSPVTAYHMDYFTEDILSMPGGIEGIFNIFEYDEDLKFNEEKMKHDIELYGEFTYEDFKDLVPEDIFNSFQTRYFTVAIGKGNLTMERIKYYIDRYGPLMI